MSQEFIPQIVETINQINILEFSGLVFGLLCVLYLIRENVLTFLFGILYVLVSFVVFWKARLYGDFLLHIFYLILNIYGWYHWTRGKGLEDKLAITEQSTRQKFWTLLLSVLMIYIFAQFLMSLPRLADGIPAPSLPYWDSTTSVLSVTGMWLTARKKIDNWYYWLLVDILATGIYAYKSLFFYAVLYLIYIVLAIVGYMAWRKSMKMTVTAPRKTVTATL